MIPIFTYRAAPKAAPLETPSVKGVASGLRNIAWKAIPLIAKEPPARNAVITRGILILQKISAFILSATELKIVSIEIVSIPINGAINITMIAEMAIEINIKILFLFELTLPPVQLSNDQPLGV